MTTTSVSPISTSSIIETTELINDQNNNNNNSDNNEAELSDSTEQVDELESDDKVANDGKTQRSLLAWPQDVDDDSSSDNAAALLSNNNKAQHDDTHDSLAQQEDAPNASFLDESGDEPSDAFVRGFESELEAAGLDRGTFPYNETLRALDNPYTDSRLDVQEEEGVGGDSWRGGWAASNWAANDNSFAFGDAETSAEPCEQEKRDEAAGRAAALRAIDADKARWGGGQPLHNVSLPLSVVHDCPRASAKFLSHFANKPKYKHEQIIDSPDVNTRGFYLQM